MDTAKKLQTAVQKFNTKPKEGIAYLVTNNVIDGRPDEIAKFLHTGEKLDRDKIGEYLGEG